MSYKPFKMKGHSLPGISQRKADKTADGRPGSSALQMKTDAELKAADQAKQDKSQRQQNGKGMTDKERSAADKKSAMKKLDRSKARRNDPDDGVVSASEASGGMFMKKSPTKKLDDGKNRKAKERVKSAKSTVKAYVEPGETKRLGGSIYQEKYEGTGETKYSKKAGRKITKAEKKLSQAEKAALEGNTRKAARKSRKAIKKADKAINTMGKGGSGRTTRSVQDKYKDK